MHDSVCQIRGHECSEIDALRARVAELEAQSEADTVSLQKAQSVIDERDRYRKVLEEIINHDPTTNQARIALTAFQA